MSPPPHSWRLEHSGDLKMRIVPALFSSVIVCGLLAIRMAIAADSPPAWAYTPNNPDYKPNVDDGKPVRVPDSTAGYTWSQLRDRSLRRFGTQVTTARCRTSSRTAANPVCSRADFVTARQDPVVRKTQVLQGCRRATSSSRWPTIRAARAVRPSLDELHQS
jgi:hypothetical protein